ncbi:hypothetical protein [Pseudobutyrivibrio sp. MD2005]|uniref:hypothetical protein n=1 Tax=Pseudobutyrivibrio sp. MD2005 TaxID=1410616 RepID=UPI0004854FAE|nr:hypothetical protein [Pseudobutyrivibrio sp. MD2005]
MKRKFLGLFLAGVMMASVVGCGNDKAESDSSNEATTETAAEVENQKADKAEAEDTTEEAAVPTETSIEFIKEISEESAPDIDIEGCDTFTQIVDKKLEPGMGYTNIDFGDTNVLMVCSGTYDNMDGNMAAIDATMYIYKGDEIQVLGKVCSGGTAYPLSTDGTYLYTGSNHWVCKYAVTEDGVKILEKASVEYTTDGAENYFYESEDEGDNSNYDSAGAEKKLNDLYDEMFASDVINFDTIVE